MKFSSLKSVWFALIMLFCTMVYGGQVPGNSGIPGISSSPVNAKTWKKINMAIQAEDWKTLARLSMKSIPKYKTENNLEQAYLRYLHIWSTMGLFRDNLVTGELAQAKLDAAHKGKQVMFPHKFKCKDGQVPNNCYGNTDDNRLLINFTNFKEDFKLIEAKITTLEKPNLTNYAGKDIYVFGNVSDMKVAPKPIDVGVNLSITGATIFQVGTK